MEKKFLSSKPHNFEHKPTAPYTRTAATKSQPERIESSSIATAPLFDLNKTAPSNSLRCCEYCRRSFGETDHRVFDQYRTWLGLQIDSFSNQHDESTESEHGLTPRRISTIDFIDLFRRRLHYDRLGLSVTSLERIYMGGCRSRHRFKTPEARSRKRTFRDNSTQTEKYQMDRLDGGHLCDCCYCVCKCQESCACGYACECDTDSDSWETSVSLRQRFRSGDSDCDFYSFMAKKRSKQQEQQHRQRKLLMAKDDVASLPSSLPSLPSLPTTPTTPTTPPPSPPPPPPLEITLQPPSPPPRPSLLALLSPSSPTPSTQMEPIIPDQYYRPDMLNDGAQGLARRNGGRYLGDLHGSEDSERSTSMKIIMAPNERRLLIDANSMRGVVQKKSIVHTDRSSQVSCAAFKCCDGNRLKRVSADSLNEVCCSAETFFTISSEFSHSDQNEREQSTSEEIARSAFILKELEQLSRGQRVQDIEQRLQRMHQFQQKTDDSFFRMLRDMRLCEKHHTHHTHHRKPKATHFECPLQAPDCALLTNESLLAHFLKKHLNVPGLALNEVYKSDKVLITFKPRTFTRSHNICLSMIVLTETRNRSSDMPLASYQPVYNGGLPIKYAKFASHLPLLVMACRIRRLNYNTEKKDRELQKQQIASIAGRHTIAMEFPEEEPNGSNVMGLWMASMELTRPLHVHMTVFNRQVDTSRSSIMEVRGLNRGHNFEQFMRNSKNYLRLTGQDLRVLTNDYKDPIYLELSVRDYRVVPGDG